MKAKLNIIFIATLLTACGDSNTDSNRAIEIDEYYSSQYDYSDEELQRQEVMGDAGAR